MYDMQQPSIITIDGPAGSGKSTLGERLAQHLGYLYFDTGIMYRAVTLAALQQGANLHDEQLLTQMAQEMHIVVIPPTQNDGRQYTVLIDDHDVTWAIRTPQVDQNVSLISSYPGVRHALIPQQRVIARQGHVVMVGRDIGTVVMPDAPLKIYLNASLEVRAQRRIADSHAQGHHVSLEQVQANIARRDALDEHVLQPAADAHILYTDTLSIEDEIKWVMALFDDHTD